MCDKVINFIGLPKDMKKKGGDLQGLFIYMILLLILHDKWIIRKDLFL